MSKVKDTNYLAITAMLAARETKMLSAERMERMIDAPTNDEAAKILEECGYGDLSGLVRKGGRRCARGAHRGAVR